MKRITMVFGLLVVGALAAHFVPVLHDSHVVVYAQCSETVPGRNISSSGTLVCDCTIATNQNCNCVVPKKCPGGEEFEIEQGAN